MSTNPEKAVSYILTKPVWQYMDKDVLLLNQDIRTRVAAKMLHHYETDDIIVTDEDRNPIGIVTDEDILNKVSDVAVYAETKTLRDVMSTPLIMMNEKATLQDALHKMRDNGIRKLPVINKKNQVIGMIYQTTIANAIRQATATPPRLLSPPVKAILGNLGFVLQFAGVLLLVPAIISTLMAETNIATGIYLNTVLLLATGFFLNAYGEKASLNLRQASVLVFSSLLLLTLFGTTPYLYVMPTGSSAFEAFSNAFFSSAAGFTTGGISLFDEPEVFPQSFTFYRSFTQLVGGMSFIYLVITAFYPESKLQSMRGFISGRTLHMRELFGTITIIFALYIVIVALLLWIFGERDLMDNFSLAMSTLATGGFRPSSTILDDLLWQENIVLMGAMILGALPFTFHYGFVRKKFLSPKLGKEVLLYFAILSSATVLFMMVSGFDYLESAFYSVSASSTAGLQKEDLAQLNAPGHAILIMLMFIGGCGFSTAGGLKIFRLFHIRHFKSVFSKKKRESLPIETRKEVYSTLIIVTLFPLIAALTAVHLAYVENVSYENAFFESVGVITTGGLSAGAIDFDTPGGTKIALAFLMILGRLEIIAIIYIFVPKLS